MEKKFRPATLYHPVTRDRVEVKTKEDADKYFKSNYKLEKEPPASVSRMEETAGSTTPMYEDVRKSGSKKRLLDYIREGIKRKQRQNKDIRAGKTRWRTFKRDTSPFKDKAFQRMSPADQASIRASRDAAASAHLQGLREEEEYRGTRLSDTLEQIRGAQEESRAEQKDARQARLDRLDIASKMKDLGYTPNPRDIYGSDKKIQGNRVGGSLSWRNINPANLKYKEWQKQYGAKKDPNSAFAVFPDEESAKRAYKALLTSQTGVYGGLSPNEAMWKWSGSGQDTTPSYTYDELIQYGAPAVSISSLSDLDNRQWSQLFEAMKAREGWEEGDIVGDTDTEISEDEQAIMDILGLTLDEVAELSDSELENLLKASEKDLQESLGQDFETERRSGIYEVVDSAIEEERSKGTDPNKIHAKLVRNFPDLSTTEIDASMVENGYEWDQTLYKWK